MRTIQVSDATYAALWAKWREGDDGEEGVLRRLLGVQNKSSTSGGGGRRVGYRDNRFGVEFPQGFEIFRVFKGTQYRAVAEDGQWRQTHNNRLVRSLNQLSANIGAPTENAWTGWNYKDGERIRPIADLRDPSKVRRRT